MRTYKITHAHINAHKYTHVCAHIYKRARMRNTNMHAPLNLNSHVRTRIFSYCGMRLREAGLHDEYFCVKKLGKGNVIM